MPNYHTAVAGMEGTGEPVVPEGALPATEARDPAKIGGGAFSGMQVTAQVKSQIEQGSAGDFFYFEESKNAPGKYDMRAKLPEYGCDGPGKPVFKLRENNNRLFRGFAKKMLKKDGSLDPEGGKRFLQEYARRFGSDAVLNEPPYSPEMPLETDPEILHEDALNWLAGELEIPLEEKADFKNYARAMLDFNLRPDPNLRVMQVPTYGPDGRLKTGYLGYNGLGQDNLLDLWSGYLHNCMEAQELKDDPVLSAKGPEGAPENIYQRNIRQNEEAMEELRRYANMDPAKEMGIIVPTECSGSTRSGIRCVALANQANIELGKGGKEVPHTNYIIGLKVRVDYMLNQSKKVRDQISDLETKKAGMDAAEYEKQMSALQKELVTADKMRDEILKKQEGRLNTVRWDEHHAPVIGSFVDEEGKTHFLTIEAFAPESDTLTEHPAITNQVSIGMYSDVDEFMDYYFKDNPFPVKNPESEAFLNWHVKNSRKDYGLNSIECPTILEERPDLAEKYETIGALQDKYEDAYQQSAQKLDANSQSLNAGEEWRHKYQQHRSNKNEAYQPTAGSREANFYSNYQAEFARLLRTAELKRSGVPAEHLEMYDRFLSLSEGLLRKNAAYGRAYLIHGDMMGDESKLSEADTAEIDLIIDEGNHFSSDEDDAEFKMQDLIPPLKRMLSGKSYDMKRDSDITDAYLVGFLKDNGIDPREFEEFVNAVSKSMQPVTKAAMNIQAASSELAESFRQKDVWHLKAAEREFAIQNLDTTLNAVFSKEQLDHLASKGMDIYDCIYIDGVSANEHFGNKYSFLKIDGDEAKKSDIMKKILDGYQIDIARPGKNGDVDILPLHAYSDIPSLEAGLSRRRANNELHVDFSETIRAHMNGLINGSIQKKQEPSPDFKINTSVSEDLFQQITAMNTWAQANMAGANQGNGEDIGFKEANYQVGLEIVKQMTGVKIDPNPGEKDLTLLSAALGQFCVNGIPYIFTAPEGLTKENYREVVGNFAERFCSQFREPEDARSTVWQDNISLLKSGRLFALTYTPPEPVPPKTVPHWYSRSSRETRRQEEHAFAEQQQRKQRWQERNATVADKTSQVDKLRQKEVYIDVELKPGLRQEKKVVKRPVSYADFINIDQKRKKAGKNMNPNPAPQAAPLHQPGRGLHHS